jgi:drug/metabolite transporter (DMT)-like permease
LITRLIRLALPDTLPSMNLLRRLADPRIQARLLLCVGLFVLPLGAFAWIAAPGFMEPMFGNPGSLDLRAPVFLVGVVGLVVGWLLMYRTYRIHAADFERDEGPWRYRDF